ncbi:MAG: glycosyltransferase [Candidatus Zhuqueibacterota bacterium]
MKKSTDKIRILFVLDNLTIGGAQRLVLDLVNNLDAGRFQSGVCTLFSHPTTDSEPFVATLRDAGIPLERFGLTSWRDLKTLRRFSRLVKEWNVDVIHGHQIPADFWGCFMGKVLLGKKTVYTRHNSYPVNELAGRRHMLLLNRFAADRIVVISQAIKNYAEEVTGAPAKKLKVILNGVDVDRFNPGISGEALRRELGIGPEDIVIGNISRFEPRKGYDVFMCVAAGLAQRFPHVRFLACGHGPLRDELIRTATDLALGEKLILRLPSLSVEQCLAAMDIFLFPTYWGEGLPLSVCEAMACAKPIVASNIGSNNELVIDGQNGFLPEPAGWRMETETLSAEPFISKISELVVNSQLRRRMGNAGRSRVLAFFNLRTMVRQHEQLYEELMQVR